jgi:hypothetical protein
MVSYRLEALQFGLVGYRYLSVFLSDLPLTPFSQLSDTLTLSDHLTWIGFSPSAEAAIYVDHLAWPLVDGALLVVAK